MKIIPTNRLLKQLSLNHKKIVLLVGTRRSESQNRRRNMDKHKITATKMSAHSSISGCRIFAPLADFVDNDVWQILLQRRPPWGGTHRELITLYRNAGGGECPLILTKADVPSCGTSSPRFGCWTCTVIQKDKSMRGVIASGKQEAEQDKLEALADFREWLVELREDNSKRMPIRRNGTSKTREDGSRIYGPFKMEVRQKILTKLHELSDTVGTQLISPMEEKFIEEIWRIDNIQEAGRKVLMQAVGA